MVRTALSKLMNILNTQDLGTDKGRAGAFNTYLFPWEISGFEDWKKSQDFAREAVGRGSIINDLPKYDMQGAYLAGQNPKPGEHWTDLFKKPWHETFSTDSKYHGVDNYYGGVWGKDYFVPSQTNIETTGLEELRKHFLREPGFKLIEPDYNY